MYLSLTSSPPIEDRGIGSQLSFVDYDIVSLSTLGHFGLYFFLAGSLLTYFHDSTKGHFEAFLIAVFFGALLEVIQLSIANRYFSLLDILANSLGASLIFLDHRLKIISKIIYWEEKFLEKYII